MTGARFVALLDLGCMLHKKPSMPHSSQVHNCYPFDVLLYATRGMRCTGNQEAAALFTLASLLRSMFSWPSLPEHLREAHDVLRSRPLV